MEDCSYGDLSTHIERKITRRIWFTEAEILLLLVQVTAALDFSHSRKIAHCDLKPQNIFVKSDGSVKVGDFGKKKKTSEYDSPEMLTGKWDLQTDIWSLGCILFELCTLQKPFDNLKIVAEQDIDFNRIANLDLQELIKYMLKKDPCERPTAHQLLKFVEKELTTKKIPIIKSIRSKLGIFEKKEEVFVKIPSTK